MKIVLFFFTVFLFTDCYSQKRVVFHKTVVSQNTLVYSIEPNWENFSSEIIKAQHIKSDSVYSYKKRRKNKDSAIRMAQYFDTLGNLIERDEYDFDGKISKIINYTYADTALLKQETISKEIFYIKGSNISKKVKTYERDSSGNITLIKEYSFFGDSLRSSSTTSWRREYDNSNCLTKEYLTPSKGETYLRHTYLYTNGILTEVKSYGTNKEWIYSYLYEFDQITRVKSIYLYNASKKLSHEFFYDDNGKLIKEQDYDQGHDLKDHITQTYSYTSNGQLETQELEGLTGESYYFRHFYSK
jgi:hypothetical protein